MVSSDELAGPLSVTTNSPTAVTGGSGNGVSQVPRKPMTARLPDTSRQTTVAVVFGPKPPPSWKLSCPRALAPPASLTASKLPQKNGAVNSPDADC
jgi:hypothetical protein